MLSSLRMPSQSLHTNGFAMNWMAEITSFHLTERRLVWKWTKINSLQCCRDCFGGISTPTENPIYLPFRKTSSFSFHEFTGKRIKVLWGIQHVGAQVEFQEKLKNISQLPSSLEKLNYFHPKSPFSAPSSLLEYVSSLTQNNLICPVV